MPLGIEKENNPEKNKINVVSIERLKNRSDFLRTAKGKTVHKKAFVLQGRLRSDSATNIRIGFTCTKKSGKCSFEKLSKTKAQRSGSKYFSK